MIESQMSARSGKKPVRHHLTRSLVLFSVGPDMAGEGVVLMIAVMMMVMVMAMAMAMAMVMVMIARRSSSSGTMKWSGSSKAAYRLTAWMKTETRF